MRPLVLISALVVLVSGRPEPPSGYNYPSPGGGFGVGGINIGSTGLGGGSLGISSGGFGQGNFGGGGSLGISSGSSGFGQSIGGGGGGFIGGGGFSAGLPSGSLQGVGFNQGGVQVHKSVYVHVAPEEPEVVRQSALIQAAPRQKHYKIIFIKAPSYAAQQQQILAQQAAQKEEKTIVYVLVRKPEAPADIAIPSPAQVQQNKPEVYFIRYKTKNEASLGGAGGALIGGGTGLGGGALIGGGDASLGGSLGGGVSLGNAPLGNGASLNAISGGSSFSTSGLLNQGAGSAGLSTKYGPPTY